MCCTPNGTSAAPGPLYRPLGELPKKDGSLASSSTLAKMSAKYLNTSRKAMGRTKALALQATCGIASRRCRGTGSPSPTVYPARRASATGASRRRWQITCHASGSASPWRAAPLAWRRATGSCRPDELRFLGLRHEGAFRLFQRGWTIRRWPAAPTIARDSRCGGAATCAGPATSWPNGNCVSSC